MVHDGIHTETLFAAVMRLVGDEAALKDLLGSGDDSHARTAAIRRALSNVLPESSCSLTPKVCLCLTGAVHCVSVVRRGTPPCLAGAPPNEEFFSQNKPLLRHFIPIMSWYSTQIRVTQNGCPVLK